MLFKIQSLRKLIKTPLRYPGGKSKALKKLLPFIPPFKEYREPFVGGGSVFLTLKQLQPKKRYWINDLHTDLYSFWYCLKHHPKTLIRKIQSIRNKQKDGRKLYQSIK